MRQRILGFRFSNAIFVSYKLELVANINKKKQGRYYRALSYLQGAVGHVNIKYVTPILVVQEMDTFNIFPVGEMSNSVGPVGYPIAHLPDQGALWVGFELTDKPGDVYRYYAWAVNADHTVREDFPLLRAGVEDQRKYTTLLRHALDNKRRYEPA